MRTTPCPLGTCRFCDEIVRQQRDAECMNNPANVRVQNGDVGPGKVTGGRVWGIGHGPGGFFLAFGTRTWTP